MAGLLNLLPLLGVLCSVSLALGLSVAAPLATPVFLLIAFQQLLWITLLQHVTGLATRFLAASRVAVAVLATAAIALVVRLALAMDQGLPQALGVVLRCLTSALQVLPFSQARDVVPVRGEHRGDLLLDRLQGVARLGRGEVLEDGGRSLQQQPRLVERLDGAGERGRGGVLRDRVDLRIDRSV